MKFNNDNYKAIDEKLIPKIIVVGVGGTGNNTVTKLNETGIDNVHTIAINTIESELEYCQADDKIFIGNNLRGRGEHNPTICKGCAEENENEIYEKLKSTDLVFIVCGLGGGTGTGASPVVSRLARKVGALTVAVVTMPFSSEGILRRESAEKGLEKLRDNADTVIVVPNDKLLEVAPNLTVNNAFLVLDEILGRVVKGITELITKPSLVNLDFADVRIVLQGYGMAMIGIAESDSSDRALESVHEALNSPLLDLDLSTTQGALINITGSSNITLIESEKIIATIADKLDPEANIAWGVQIDDSLENTIITTIIAIGKNHKIYPVDPPFEKFDYSNLVDGKWHC